MSKAIIRRAVDEFNRQGWSHTHRGIGAFGLTPTLAYENWLTMSKPH